jgi:hypothetical protein
VIGGVIEVAMECELDGRGLRKRKKRSWRDERCDVFNCKSPLSL